MTRCAATDVVGNHLDTKAERHRAREGERVGSQATGGKRRSLAAPRDEPRPALGASNVNGIVVLDFHTPSFVTRHSLPHFHITFGKVARLAC